MRACAFAVALLIAGIGALPSGAQTLDTVRVAFGLTNPLYVCSPPGDVNRVFIVQKNGHIRILKNGVLLAADFLNIQALVSGGSEQGLLGMAFHPNFATNGFYFLDYTNTSGHTVIARYQVPGNPMLTDVSGTTGTILFTITQPFTNHNGGCIQFGPDGYLYIAMGDGGSGNDPQANAQNVNSPLGKMLRIDVNSTALGNYGIPPTNPYAGATPGDDRVFHIGLRNPWRFSFDRMDGALWIGDVGQNAREEVDYAPPGAVNRNFGWRCMEATLCTGLTGCTCNAATLTLPVWNYVLYTAGTCTVIGGYVYRGCAIPWLRGTYFFADYCGNQIWSFPGTGATQTSVTDRTAELAPGGGLSISSITSFGEDAQGELYICDMGGGEVFKIIPQTPLTNGIVSYGAGTPGCLGAHTLSATCPPTINNPVFGLSCTNPPPSSTGLGIISAGQLPAGSDPFGIGVFVLVDAMTAGAYFPFFVTSGAAGPATIYFSIPNSASLINITVYVQEFWSWTTCNPSPLNVSSTNGLALTIQP